MLRKLLTILQRTRDPKFLREKTRSKCVFSSLAEITSGTRDHLRSQASNLNYSAIGSATTVFASELFELLGTGLS